MHNNFYIQEKFNFSDGMGCRLQNKKSFFQIFDELENNLYKTILTNDLLLI